MKYLLLLLFPVFVHGQSPKVMAEASSVITNKISDTLYATACDLNCLPIASWAWVQVSGPKQAIAVRVNDSTMIATRLTSGNYIFRMQVANSAGIQGIDTVGFSVNLPCPVCPPATICPPIDSAAVAKAYLIAHPLPPCPVCPTCPPPIICPPIPAPRLVIGITWDIINNRKVITFNYGPAQTL